MIRLLLAFSLSSMLAFPAVISLGVKGGIPITSNFETGTSANPNVTFTADTKRYTVGPVIELHLPWRFGIEADALYQRLDYQSQEELPGRIVNAVTTANAWRFPLLLKYRFASGPVIPFISAGPSFRYVSNINQVENFFTGTTASRASTSEPASLNNRFAAGFTAAGGLEFGSSSIHIAPEIRYTRWGWENFRSFSGVLHSRENQVEFLVGLTF